MIKLQNILNEANIKVNNVTANFRVIATPTSLNNMIRFIAASSKDLDILQDISKDEIREAILKYANKQFREIKFLPVKYDEGAGYGFKIDLNTVLKRLK
jgi:hypothetical protein|tara:strand:+ start:2793 stop:3089 length:297 start_codon:yes stop_codon:yes gene_type:complete